MSQRFKLAILVSHPIQYHVPLYRALAKQDDIDLEVFFCWDSGAKKTYDPEFGKEIQWDIPMLSDYRYTFLRNYSPRPSTEKLWGLLNFGIISALFHGRFDAILVYGWNRPSHWLAFLGAFLTRTPLLLQGENPMNQERFRSPMRRFLKKLFLRVIFSIPCAFLYIGKENKKFYLHYGVPDRKLFFVPYAIDIRRFMDESKRLRGGRAHFRSELGIGEAQPVFLFTGKLIHKKRPLELLEAYARVVEKFHSSALPVLLYVGDGALRVRLEAYATRHGLRHVHFVGFKNQTELSRYYVLSDVFILPSGVGETWGLVVNEAMCFGLPVVVSDVVGCASDLVHDGRNGFVVPLDDVESLADRMGKLAHDASLRARFGEESFRVVQGYSYEHDVRGIKEALRSVLG